MDIRGILASGAALALLGTAGLVAAQPAPTPIQPPPLPLPPISGKAAPATPPPEEAPPATVAPPTPIAAPPVQASEVAPAPPPKEQVAPKTAEPVVKRPRYDIAVIQALDKVSARSVRFEAAVGKPVRYKSLVFTVRACERSAEDEAQADSMAHITVQSQPRPAPGKPAPPPRQAFRGWMYASSPGLNPLEHPIYDAWLITCRTNAPERVAGAVTPAARAAAPASARVAAAPPAKPAPAPAPKVVSPPAPAPKTAPAPAPAPESPSI